MTLCIKRASHTRRKRWWVKATVVTVRFKQPPSVDQLRSAINAAGIRDAIIQPVLDKQGMFLIKVPHQGSEEVSSESQAGVDAARDNVRKALNTFGREADPTKTLEADGAAAYKIEGTDAVGQVASEPARWMCKPQYSRGTGPPAPVRVAGWL